MRHVSGHRPQIAATCVPDFRRMGRGTRTLQSFREGLEDLDDFNREQELAVLDERVRRLGLAGGAPPRGWRALRESIAELRSVPAAESVVAHRDLHDGQWLLEDDRACLLDFDLLCRAEPELDAANFLAHLELRRLQHPARVSEQDVAVCREAFLEGLGAADSADHRARLALYEATTFARLSLVYQLRPRWSGIVGDLIARARNSLAELGDR
jgi:aminoglycoside phosphotransferase (APT) family kinase protein